MEYQFNPADDPVFDIAGSMEEFSVDDDPVFMSDMAPSSAPYQSNSGVFGAPLGSRLGGIPSASFPSATTTPTGGGLQADLLNGTDPWAAPQSEIKYDDSFGLPATGGSKLLPSIGGVQSGNSHWQCEQCAFLNNFGATRCQSCNWDRKAALKLRMRQDLMAKMASNGSIPGTIA